MAFDRKIAHVGSKRDVMEGAGVLVGRVLPQARLGLEPLDPFLLLDHFKAEPGGPGFPPHPHRGFEILTYAMQGWGQHEDDQGNRGRIEAGGVMRLRAGSGMWHGEAGGSDQPGGTLEGIQFWVNLPKAQKKVKPAFQLAQDKDLPRQTQAGGAQVKVLVGPGSPIEVLTPMVYLDVSLPAGAAFQWELDPAQQGFVYGLEGSLSAGAGGDEVGEGKVGVLGEGGGLKVMNQGKATARFLLAAGQPHREPVIWNGPFVD